MSSRRSRAAVAAFVAGVALGLTGCGGDSPGATADSAQAEAGATPAITLVDPAGAQALVDGGDVEVIDVRTPEEYTEGHIAGATLIDFYEPDFAEQIGRLDRDQEYVVYCRSGNRSGQATELMAKQGFSAVNDVDGGIVAWQAAGLPVER